MPFHHSYSRLSDSFPAIKPGFESVKGQSFFDKDFSGFTSAMMPQPDSDFNPYSGSHVAVIIDGKGVIFNQNLGLSTYKRAEIQRCGRK